jgi:mannan endo-1,4-beta-mannosidase
MMLRLSRSLFSVAVLVAAAIWVVTPGASQQAVAATTSGFVSHNGTELVANGKPWRFAGYNIPCQNVFQSYQDGSLSQYLSSIQQNSGGNVIRVWFFQSEGGPGNWADFDGVISTFKALGLRAVVTLSNQFQTCDEPSPTTSEKSLAWYQSGYRSPDGGYSMSFRDYATAVAAHYANEPTVAFWQLVNEAEAPTISATGQVTCDEAAAASALRAFSDDMVSAIHSVDPNHLVNLGTQGSGQCGTAGSDYQYVYGGTLDLCEYHDYGQPGVSEPSSLASDVAACRALGKPIFVGESGIPNDVQPDGSPPATTCSPDYPACDPSQPDITQDTLDQRAAFFQAKLQAADQAGIAGYLIWVKSPYYTDTTDGYAIANGDPTEAVVQQYGLLPYPSSPPPSVPEAPLAIGLVGVAGAVLITFTRRRRRVRFPEAGEPR